MRSLIKIRAAQALDERRLRLRFSDGVTMDVDLGNVLAEGGVFEPLRADPELFKAVRVNPETGTVEWPGEVDLDAEVLYGREEPASGTRIRRERVAPPAS